MSNYTYFPVCLLNGASEDLVKSCYDILCYQGYEIARTYKKGDSNGGKMFYAGTQVMGYTFEEPEKAFEIGENIYLSIKEDLRLTQVCIQTSEIVEAMESYHSEFDTGCFIAYCALRSIVQRATWKQVSPANILSRMIGSSKLVPDMMISTLVGKKELVRVNPNKLPEKLKYLSKPYQWNLLQKELIYRYGVTYFSKKHQHPPYYSFRLNINILEEISIDRIAMKKAKINSIRHGIINKENQENTHTTKKEPTKSQNHHAINTDSQKQTNGKYELTARADFYQSIDKYADSFPGWQSRQYFNTYWTEPLPDGKLRRYEADEKWNLKERINEWIKLCEQDQYRLTFSRLDYDSIINK